MPAKTCVKQITIGDITVKVEYALWNDILYIKSASPTDTVFTITFVSKDGNMNMSSTGGDLAGRILEIPYGTTSVEISASVPVSGSLVKVNVASLSLGWNGRIKTGIIEIEVNGGKPSSAKYLPIDELGMRTIEVDDPADLCGLHIKLKTSTGWIDKYYVFTSSNAVITWDAEAIMIPPSISISEKGTIRVVYDDESVYLFHEGGPIMDSPVRINIEGDFAYLDGTPAVLKKSAALENCKEVGGCWTAKLDQLVPPSGSVLTKLVLEYEIGKDKNSAVVFPSQKALRSALSGVGIWSAIFAEMLDVDLEKATFEVKTLTLGDYKAPAQGSFLHVLFPKYYTKDSKYGAIVRGRGSNYTIFTNNFNVKASIVQMTYNSQKNVFAEGQRIADAMMYTDSVPSSGTFAVKVDENPDGNLYAIKLDGNYGSYPISFSSLGIVTLVYDPKQNKVEPVVGKGFDTVKDANGNVLGMISNGVAYVFFGTLPDGKVVVPIAAWLDGSQMSSAGGDSQAPFTVVMEVRYSPTSIVSVDSSGKLNATIPVVMLSANGPVAIGQALTAGLYRLIAPIPLDAELVVVYTSEGKYKIAKLTPSTLGSGSVTSGSTVKVVFTSSDTGALTSDTKNVVNSIAVVEVKTPSFYYNYAKELSLAQLETEGVNIYDLILLFSQISRIHEATVTLVGLFIGEPGVGFLPYDELSIANSKAVVDVPYLNINGEVINIENISTAVNSGYSVSVEFIPVLVPSGSNIDSLKYTKQVTRSSPSIDVADIANDIIGSLPFLTSDYFIVRLAVSDATSGKYFITDERIYRLLEDSGLVNVSVVGTSLSVTVSNSLSGISVVVKDKDGNTVTATSGAAIQFVPPYMTVVITPTNSLGSGIYIIVVSQSTIVETPYVKVVRALDGSIVIETDNLENVQYYYLDPSGNLTQASQKVDKPGIYIVKGTYRGLSGDVDYAAAIAVPGYAIVPTANGLEITVLSLDEATLEAKTYPAYVAILNAAGLDLMAQTVTMKGRYFKTEVSGDAINIKLCCCGECTTYSGVRKDKVVMTYAPIAAAGAVVALIKLASR